MEAPLSQKDSSDFMSTYNSSNCNTLDIIPFIHNISILISQKKHAKMTVLCLLSHIPTWTEEYSLFP